MNRPMQQAGAGLERVLSGSLHRSPTSQAPILAWSLVCGSAVADRTRALFFSEGILRVEVPDAGWRRELQSLAPRYVAGLNRYVAQSVQRIEFVIAPE